MYTRQFLTVFVAVLLAASVAGIAGGQLAETAPTEATEPGDGEVEISLVPVEGGDGVDQMYNITVVGPEAGIGNFFFEVSLADADVADIATFELTREGAFPDSGISEDNSTLMLSESLQDSSFEGAPEITLATMGVNATGEGGKTAVTVQAPEEDAVTDSTDDEEAYDVVGTQESVFPVSPPPVVGEDRPQDLNGDGLFEDINGDGELNIFDVQVLFANLESDTVQDNAWAFSFQDGDGDEVDIFDVQALFGRV